MKVTAAVLLSLVVVGSWAAPQELFADGSQYQYQDPTPHYQTQYDNEPALYTFHWEVNDDYYGNFYGHQEQRDGPITKGSYYIRLPDTRLMKVEYYADEYGYHPTITYEGEAQYPQVPPRRYEPIADAHPIPQDDFYI